MVNVLTDNEFFEILAECRANGEVVDYTEGPEQFCELPSQLGQGYWRTIQLRPGIQLQVLDLEKRQVHIHHVLQHPQNMPLTLSYYLSGGCTVNNDGIKSPTEELAGKSYWYCVPNTAETERYESRQRIRKVHLQISPDCIPAFGDYLQELPSDIGQTIEQPGKALFHYNSPITPPQQQALKQIFCCPFQGITRQVYLEAKILELLALQLNQLIADDHSVKKLPTSDVDRIYQAREILIRNMTHPPSLPELARRVQLNERKLKQGFQQVFGTTVFGCLYHYRMQQARDLLKTGQFNIQEAAQCVGYASRSSFVAAFKKKFQVSPSHFRKSN
ncbi:MAG: AraC family transcriptional regulator [Cyanobacteria bacterium P01_B01_bin.77]